MAQRTLPNGAVIPMESGERDRRVLIQQLADAVPDSRFPTEEWTTLLPSVYMRKMDVRQNERFASAQISAPIDTQWEMGYVRSMDPELHDIVKTRRLVYQGRVYDIVSASLIGRREGVELMTLATGKVA